MTTPYATFTEAQAIRVSDALKKSGFDCSPAPTLYVGTYAIASMSDGNILDFNEIETYIDPLYALCSD